MPSTSANYINSRNNAGAIGAILENENILKGLRDTKQLITFKAPEEHIENEELGTPYIADLTELRKRYEKFWIRIMGEALNEPPDAVPLGLPEPLKVRVITKGPPFLYTVLKPLQKKMWKTLFKSPCFQYIGDIVNEENLSARMGSKLKEEEYYLSVDYANATNKISSWASRKCAEVISDRLSLYKAERRLFIRSLITHNIVLKQIQKDLKSLHSEEALEEIKQKKDFIKRLQTNGQLMGSVTSFPILCIINAAICRYAYEIGNNTRIGLKNAPISINGDDALIKTNKLGDRYHLLLSKFVGLEPSIGKVYRSKEFCNINSATFLRREGKLNWNSVTGKWFNCPLEEVKYVNFGIVRGIKKSGMGTQGPMEGETDHRTTIGARTRELVRKTPEYLHKQVFNLFRKYNQIPVKYIPWYIPEWLGGLGIPKEFGTPSDLDLRMASNILMNWKKTRPVSLVLKSSWAIRYLAKAKVPQPKDFLNPELYERVCKSYDQLVSYSGIALLFDSRISLKELLNLEKSQNLNSKVQHNEMLWKPVSNLPAPLKLSRLEYEKRAEGLDVQFVSLDAQTSLKLKDNLKADLTPGFDDMSIREPSWEEGEKPFHMESFHWIKEGRTGIYTPRWD